VKTTAGDRTPGGVMLAIVSVSVYRRTAASDFLPHPRPLIAACGFVPDRDDFRFASNFAAATGAIGIMAPSVQRRLQRVSDQIAEVRTAFVRKI
jgi:hypothetical protein